MLCGILPRRQRARRNPLALRCQGGPRAGGLIDPNQPRVVSTASDKSWKPWPMFCFCTENIPMKSVIALRTLKVAIFIVMSVPGVVSAASKMRRCGLPHRDIPGRQTQAAWRPPHHCRPLSVWSSDCQGRNLETRLCFQGWFGWRTR